MLRDHSSKVQNGAMYDWNDLRSFLAVARTGSTLAASRTLRVSQTTVARRVAALEQALGLPLFDRQQAGYALTPAGEALLSHAAEVEAAATAFSEAASLQSRDATGTVRLTTQEIIALTILPPILRDLHQAHPGIHIELDTSEEVRDLAAGAADVAMRSTTSVKGGGLVGRRISADPWTVYCSRDYAAAHGIPRSRVELRAHPLIAGGGTGVSPIYDEWVRCNGLEDAVAMRHDSVPGLLAAVRSGFGLAALPSFIADQDPDLVQCLPPDKNDRVALWLLTHERLRHTPRVRIVLDFLAERLQRLARNRRTAYGHLNTDKQPEI
jgi:DNA-binding transcriptional LysR family regulator